MSLSSPSEPTELREASSELRLKDGSRVGVVGGGPAGSFFSYFLLAAAQRASLDINVVIHEARDFRNVGPKGCNMCGGIVSESLVQLLATEGINLPNTVVQRGIDSYMLHTDAGSVRIETPSNQKRIAAVHRGSGPRDVQEVKWASFDGHLLGLALGKGATLSQGRVEEVSFQDGKPGIRTKDAELQVYDLVAVAAGVNSPTSKLIEGLSTSYRPPRTTRAFICEYFMGREALQRHIGNSMHVFLLNIPRVEFAAVIPKHDYATACMLGEDVDKALVRAFLSSPEVRRLFPPGWDPERYSCQCMPRMNVGGAVHPYADRIVILGDCGVTRLYKDGIGGAYRTAKAAANTAVFNGISRASFERHYWPACLAIATDNMIGRLTFAATRGIQKRRFGRRALINMVAKEQKEPGRRQPMSQVMWDLFTGSATYREVILRALHPVFVWNLLRAVFAPESAAKRTGASVIATASAGDLGATYEDGQVIVRQGEVGDCMHVIQEGRAVVTVEKDGKEVRLRELGAGEIIGEMAIFDKVARSATVRAVGRTRVLAVDKTTLLGRIHQDPSLAFNIMQTMSRRIRDLSEEVRSLRSHGGPIRGDATDEHR
jgi:flavin-dependent dehydrogenase